MTNNMNKQETLKSFQEIPGVGKSVSQDFWNLGFRSIRELNGAIPEELYMKLCDFQKTQVDRCMLYVFRCAVYYASNKEV